MIRVCDSRKFIIAVALLLSTILVYITKIHRHLVLPHLVLPHLAFDAVSQHDDFAMHQMYSAYNQDHAKEHLKGRWGTSLNNIFNSTLGFQAVSTISLPGRTDRQDSFALAASVTGFTYYLTDGVDGPRVPAKALPYTMDVTAGEIGCWRAHLNIWQKMVRDHTSTMLVFEDDADWDIGLRAQLLEFAKGARFVLGDTRATAQAPYGHDWDLLWIGHCGTVPHPLNDRRFVIPNDPTVVSPNHRLNRAGHADMSRYENAGHLQTRVITQAFGGVCTASYAISLRGAQKALYRLSMQPYNDPVDIGLSDLCKDKDFFTCVAPWPQIMGTFIPAGNRSVWSDIHEGAPSGIDEVDEEGHSQEVAFSTKANLAALWRGSNRFENTYADATAQNMTIMQITRGVGHEELVSPSRFVDMTAEELSRLHWDDGLPF